MSGTVQTMKSSRGLYFFLKSYRSRMAIVLLVAFVPFIVADAYKNLELKKKSENDLINKAHETTSMLLKEHSEMMLRAKRELALIAQAEQIACKTLESCREYLGVVKKSSDIFVNIGVANLEGNLVCSYMDFTQVSQEAKKAFDAAKKTKMFSFSNAKISSNHNMPIIPTAQPILGENGEVEKVLMAGIGLMWFNEKVFSDLNLPQGASIYLADKEGTLLAKYPIKKERVGKVVADPEISSIIADPSKGMSIIESNSGRLTYLIHSDFQDGIKVAMELDATEIKKIGDTIFLWGLLYFIAVVLLSGLIVLFVAKRLIIQEVDAMLQINIAQSKYAAASELLTNIAHQWRQPLNVVTLGLENIRDFLEHKLSKQDVDEVHGQLDAIDKNVRRLSEIINNFTDFFKNDGEKSTFYIADAIEDVVKIIQDNAKHQRVTLSSNVGNIELLTYKSELVRCLLAIANNSLEAYRINDKIADEERFIKIDAFMENEESVQMIISDNGGGIDAALLPKIFEPYSTTKFKSDRVGLGLYMVKSIIENRLGGIIYIESPDKGVRVIIKLPIKCYR